MAEYPPISRSDFMYSLTKTIQGGDLNPGTPGSNRPAIAVNGPWGQIFSSNPCQGQKVMKCEGIVVWRRDFPLPLSPDFAANPA